MHLRYPFTRHPQPMSILASEKQDEAEVLSFVQNMIQIIVLVYQHCKGYVKSSRRSDLTCCPCAEINGNISELSQESSYRRCSIPHAEVLCEQILVQRSLLGVCQRLFIDRISVFSARSVQCQPNDVLSQDIKMPWTEGSKFSQHARQVDPTAEEAA